MDQNPEPGTEYQYVEPVTTHTPDPAATASGRNRNRPGRRKSFTAVLLTALVTFVATAILSAGVGLLIYGNMDSSTATLSFDNTQAVRDRLAKIDEMRGYLKANFLEELTDEQLLDAMVSGLADNLGNPYTFYLDKENYTLWQESLNGVYYGIGASVIVNKAGFIQISSVVAGGPADLAGLKTGDELVSVDGEDITTLKDTNVIATRVKGAEGTTVKIGIHRPSTGTDFELQIVRARIVSDPIRSLMLMNGIGYIQIKEFSEGLDAEFRVAVQGLIAKGATSFVFDLRNDPGGSAVEVTGMLDYLLPYGEIASIKGRQDGKAFDESWTSDSKAGVPDTMRYAILVNGYTASASELFSGCLRDFGKAWLIGTQTFGKGSGTITYALSDGSAVNVTTFRYYLPSGVCIEGEGLAPDQVVELPEAVASLSVEEIPRDQDTQLQAAIVYLANLP
jgi:carboxyl-terminal processing protease